MYKLILALFVLAFACNKPEPFGVRYTGSATAILNDSVEWEARTFMVEVPTQRPEFADYYILQFEVSSPAGYLRERFVIGPISPSTDTLFPAANRINSEGVPEPTIGYGTLQDDGDVTCTAYRADTTFNNYVVFDEFNLSNFRVRGRFRYRGIKRPESPPCTLFFADTVTFEMGSFDINGLSIDQ